MWSTCTVYNLLYVHIHASCLCGFRTIFIHYHDYHFNKQLLHGSVLMFYQVHVLSIHYVSQTCKPFFWKWVKLPTTYPLLSLFERSLLQPLIFPSYVYSLLSWLLCHHLPPWCWWPSPWQPTPLWVWSPDSRWLWLHPWPRSKGLPSSHEAQQGDGGGDGGNIEHRVPEV